MSGVYGRKVKEPKVTTRGNIQFKREKVDKQAEGKNDLFKEPQTIFCVLTTFPSIFQAYNRLGTTLERLKLW